MSNKNEQQIPQWAKGEGWECSPSRTYAWNSSEGFGISAIGLLDYRINPDQINALYTKTVISSGTGAGVVWTKSAAVDQPDPVREALRDLVDVVGGLGVLPSQTDDRDSALAKARKVLGVSE